MSIVKLLKQKTELSKDKKTLKEFLTNGNIFNSQVVSLLGYESLEKFKVDLLLLKESQVNFQKKYKHVSKNEMQSALKELNNKKILEPDYMGCLYLYLALVTACDVLYPDRESSENLYCWSAANVALSVCWLTTD